MLSNVLIIDKRKELSTKYKKSLEDEQVSVTVARTLKDGIKLIQLTEPDLIIISDSIDEELTSFCEKIRTLTFDTRPTIVALSKSADTNDRISVLSSGADDFLSEPVNIEEFKMRVRAHLRRDVESNSYNVTHLPNKKYVYKALKRIINSEIKPALLLVSIENLNNYKTVYSDFAGDKLVQTLVAITKSTLDKNDFLGQLNDETFLIVTNPYRAEKMASFLTFAFDTVVPKFYSEEDAKRGYTLLYNDAKAGMRANFVSILIGGLIENYDTVTSPERLLERLYSIKKVAKIPSGSNYAVERIKLTGENSVILPSFNRSIYIQESDEALSLLLKTTFELQGYDVLENINYDKKEQPKIIIIDTENDMSGLEACTELKNKKEFIDTKFIVTSNEHDKTAILNAGADLYLPKPYEISDLVRWVEYFIKK